MDAFTAVRIIDFIPLSWIGSLAIGISIAVILIVTMEELHEKNYRLYKEVIYDKLTSAFSRSYFEVQFEKNISKEDILAVADIALYKSKDAGKNRVEILDPLIQGV